jgi:enterochelin esterase-like enzyme
VTFRFSAPNAPGVQLEGEWYFSSPGHTRIGSSEGRLPSKWKPGDFPIGWPNYGTTAGWPIIDMTKDSHTGVWTAEVPLPSGVFNYDFILGCSAQEELEAPAQPVCTHVSDPSNPPWKGTDAARISALEPSSQVYVPSDPAFHTVDNSWQAPASPRGRLRDVYYHAQVPASDAPAGLNRLAIYTPPGYDPHRSAPYPTLYLNPGFSANEIDWSTRADAANILDNLIDAHRAEPMVVVMTNFAFTDCLEDDASSYSQNLFESVIPYVEAHYRVARLAARRAFAGLSCGGELAGSLLLHHTSSFDAFGVFSPSSAYSAAITPTQARAMRKVHVMVGGGTQDPIHEFAVSDLASLRTADVPVFSDFVNGGHDWYVWRIQLHDFLQRIAFH